ncbi:MAG: hypothetical protein NVS3B12_15860 [Acidimicrobiales bacterium]
MDEDERKQIVYPEHPGFGSDEEPSAARISLTFDVICDEDPQYLADDMWALVKKALEDRGAAVDGGTMVATTTPPAASGDGAGR